MPTHRPLRTVLLYGGWLLLFNPDPSRPNAPLSSWKKVKEFDTAYLCEQRRNEEVTGVLAKAPKRDRREAPKTPADAEMRYRCERVERVPRKR